MQKNLKFKSKNSKAQKKVQIKPFMNDFVCG